MAGIIKTIWELLKSSPAIIGIINELLKLIRGIASSDKDTKEEIKQARTTIKGMRSGLSNPRL